MAPPRMMGDGRMAKDPKKTFVRLLGYMLQYKFHVLMVLLCIFAHALVQSRSAVMLGTLVDGYILPMVETGSTDFGPILIFLLQMVLIFLVGIVCSFLQITCLIEMILGSNEKVGRKRQNTPLQLRCEQGAQLLMDSLSPI